MFRRSKPSSESVVGAALDCPGDCIFLEPDDDEPDEDDGDDGDCADAELVEQELGDVARDARIT